MRHRQEHLTTVNSRLNGRSLPLTRVSSCFVSSVDIKIGTFKVSLLCAQSDIVVFDTYVHVVDVLGMDRFMFFPRCR